MLTGLVSDRWLGSWRGRIRRECPRMRYMRRGMHSHITMRQACQAKAAYGLRLLMEHERTLFVNPSLL